MWRMVRSCVFRVRTPRHTTHVMKEWHVMACMPVMHGAPCRASCMATMFGPPEGRMHVALQAAHGTGRNGKEEHGRRTIAALLPLPVPVPVPVHGGIQQVGLVREHTAHQCHIGQGGGRVSRHI